MYVGSKSFLQGLYIVRLFELRPKHCFIVSGVKDCFNFLCVQPSNLLAELIKFLHSLEKTETSEVIMEALMELVLSHLLGGESPTMSVLAPYD